MKKRILFSSVFLFGFTAIYAQITINQSDIASVGTSIIQATDTLPVSAINPGSAGANQTWDFSQLHTNTTQTINFIAPSTTSFASSFSMANLAGDLGTAGKYYLNVSPSSVQIWGVSGDITGNGSQYALVYNNSETAITYPSTMGTTFSDVSSYDRRFYYGVTVNFMTIDSIRTKHINTVTSTVDAWGNITTPDGTFPGIRQNIMKHSIDSLWAKSLFGWSLVSNSTSDNQSYAFSVKNVGNTLVNITCKPNVTAIKKIDWTRATPSAINAMELNNEIKVYPTIVKEYLFIDQQSYAPFKVIIYDAVGREVFNSGFMNTNHLSIPVADIHYGIYFVKIFNETQLLKSDKIVIKNTL